MQYQPSSVIFVPHKSWRGESNYEKKTNAGEKNFTETNDDQTVQFMRQVGHNFKNKLLEKDVN